ncbi:MAG: SPOR domain-containing protein [Alcanivoracaceae bacterium]|jgi:hypothetical protein|nr:SPOR domain-containing protein [Alcanivoracaceae bacterium]
MRWVFFSLLILNVVYGVWRLALGVAPGPETASRAMQSAPQTLTLLSEVPEEQRQRRFSADTGSLGGLCPAVGPFAALSEADGVLTSLKAKGYQGVVRPVRVQRDMLHWVYLPPYPSREQALKVLRELQARGVDSFVVADGEDANAISLGYFSSKESARGLKVKMEAAGYPAGTRATAKEVTEYWLFIPADKVPDEGAGLRDVLAGSPSLEGEQVACDSRAVQEQQLRERYEAARQASADADPGADESPSAEADSSQSADTD